MATKKVLSQMLEEDVNTFVSRLNEQRPELKAAHTAHRLMIIRTRGGHDRHGKPFAPYAPGTIRIKRRKGQQVSPVNLKDSGDMLGSLTVHQQRGSQKYTVHEGRTRRVAQIKTVDRQNEKKIRFHVKGTRHMPARDFLGLTPREERAVRREFRTDVDRCIPTDRRKRVLLRIFK